MLNDLIDILNYCIIFNITVFKSLNSIFCGQLKYFADNLNLSGGCPWDPFKILISVPAINKNHVQNQ